MILKVIAFHYLIGEEYLWAGVFCNGYLLRWNFVYQKLWYFRLEFFDIQYLCWKCNLWSDFLFFVLERLSVFLFDYLVLKLRGLNCLIVLWVHRRVMRWSHCFLGYCLIVRYWKGGRCSDDRGGLHWRLFYFYKGYLLLGESCFVEQGSHHIGFFYLQILQDSHCRFLI